MKLHVADSLLTHLLYCLLVLYNLCCECSLRNDVVAYEHVALHRRDAMAQRRKQVDLKEKCVARNNLLAELHVIYLHEVSRPALWLFESVEHKQTAALSHRLNLKHARHDRLLRK